MPRIEASYIPTARAVAYPADPDDPAIRRPVAVRQPINLGRSKPPDGTSQGAHSISDPAYLNAFLAGTYTHLTSSWLKACQYDPNYNHLMVWFLDGFACTVLNVSPDEAAGLYYAGSKGSYYRSYLYSKSYLEGV